MCIEKNKLRGKITQSALIAFVLLLSSNAHSRQQIEDVVRLDSNYWVHHVTHDLIPYWNDVNRPTNGRIFPSFAFDDGSPVTIEKIGEKNNRGRTRMALT